MKRNNIASGKDYDLDQWTIPNENCDHWTTNESKCFHYKNNSTDNLYYSKSFITKLSVSVEACITMSVTKKFHNANDTNVEKHTYILSVFHKGIDVWLTTLIITNMCVNRKYSALAHCRKGIDNLTAIRISFTCCTYHKHHCLWSCC